MGTYLAIILIIASMILSGEVVSATGVDQFDSFQDQAMTVRSDGSMISLDRTDLIISANGLEVTLQPVLSRDLGESTVVEFRNSTEGAISEWRFGDSIVRTFLRYVPHGFFVNLTVEMAPNTSYITNVTLMFGLKRRGEMIDSIVTSTTPLSQFSPPKKSVVLIEALDYKAVDSLYGVAAAFVLKTGETLELVSLYPFASISYCPEEDGKIELLFRKGLGDLSTTEFQHGDRKSILFYIGSVKMQETTDNAFSAFASDVEMAFPTRNFGKPFILYGVEGGSWDEVRQEAESLGYTLIYSDYTWEYTKKTGGGHYFGLGWETFDRLKKAGLESVVIAGRDGKPLENGRDYRVNPSEPQLQAFLRGQIDSFVVKRKWFLADGADVLQDFDPRHTNALEGYIQILTYIRSTGCGIIYNSYHTPRLWLDWISDGVLIEAPTGLILYGMNGQRLDYLDTGEFFRVTREFMRVHSKFFPKRALVWQDYVSLEDYSILDSISYFLMEKATSFSFCTSKSGSVMVRPGEITEVAGLLDKQESIRQLSLGSVNARNFERLDGGSSWKFEVLTDGTVTWLGEILNVYMDGTSVNVRFDGLTSVFTVQPSSVEMIVNT